MELNFILSTIRCLPMLFGKLCCYIYHQYRYDEVRMDTMKWKIGVFLVLLMLVLSAITNAAETAKVYSSEEIRMLERQGYEIEKGISYTIPEIVSERSEVGKPVIIQGYVSASVVNSTDKKARVSEQLGYVSNSQVTFSIYKGDL